MGYSSTKIAKKIWKNGSTNNNRKGEINMTKFSELLEYIGMIDGTATCTCCQRNVEKPKVYKKDENMIVLCTECETFLEEVLE